MWRSSAALVAAQIRPTDKRMGRPTCPIRECVPEDERNVCRRASELECRVASQAVQLHGGAGYLCDTPVARAFVDSRVQTIYGGSNEVLKDVIGRQIVAPAKKRA